MPPIFKRGLGKIVFKLERVLIPAAVVLLSIPAFWQFLASDYFDGHDSVLHLLRLVGFDAALRSGDLFPRWFPDFALGYGYPLLNYYPPLTYYFAQAFHVVGLGFNDALKATIVAGLTLSGLGMYLFARDLFGFRPAALLSSVAFVYFPYHLTDVYVRGAIPEATLVVLMPFALWAFHRLVVFGTLRYVIVGALLVSGLILTHVTFIFLLPILAAYTLLMALARSSGARRQALLLGASAFGLGFALAAFYWLPVLMEKQLVSVVAADWVAEDIIKDGLLAPEALVQLSPAYDYQAKFPPRLAVTDLVLAGAGLGVWLVRKNRRELLQGLAVFLAIMPVLTFALSEASFPFWRQAPLIGMVQFPWRLLAFVGLSTSVLAGPLARCGRLSYPIAALACITIIFANTKELKLNHLEFQDTSLSLGTLARYEYDTGVMGTAYGNEWLPAAAKPSFTSPLYEPFEPVEPDGTEDAAIAGFRRTGPLSYTARVTAEQPTRLRFHTFFFPGWQAKVDGKAVETYPSTYLGLTTFDVPEGQHDVSISFADTAIRAVGRGISIVALAALSVVCLWSARRSSGQAATVGDAYSEDETGDQHAARAIHELPVPHRFRAFVNGAFRRARPPGRYILGGFPLFLAGLLLLLPYLPSAPASVVESQAVDFAGRLRLLGSEVEAQPDRDGRIRVTLYWQAVQTMEDDLRMSLEAFDGQGNLVGTQKGAPIYSTAQTSTWSRNEIVRDKRDVRLFAGMPLGPVSLRLGVWAGGNLLGSTTLGTVDVPSASSPRLLPQIAQRLEANFGDRILLLGYDVQTEHGFAWTRILDAPADSIRPGGLLRVTLHWQALTTMGQDYVVSLRLVGPAGELQAYHDSQPQMGFRQTSLWQPGEIIEDIHHLKLPPAIKPGVYKLEVNLYQHHTDAKLWPKGAESASVQLSAIRCQ